MTAERVRLDLEEFLAGHHPECREASFDYCYNFFQGFRDQKRLPDLLLPEHLPEACLHLGFYLASWGMFRGKSFLLQRSARHFGKLIQTIAATPEEVWAIDVSSYSAENMERLVQCEKAIAEAVAVPGTTPTLTLTTKIMLGVFGNVPAIDTFVFNGLATATGKKAYSLDLQSLEAVRQFYLTHQKILDHAEIYTLDFLSGEPTSRRYSQAKLVDMALFMAGQR